MELARQFPNHSKPVSIQGYGIKRPEGSHSEQTASVLILPAASFQHAGRSACDPRPISCSRQWSLWYHTGLTMRRSSLVCSQLDANLVLPRHRPVLHTLTVSSVGRYGSLSSRPGDDATVGCVASFPRQTRTCLELSILSLANLALMAPVLCVVLELYFAHIARAATAQGRIGPFILSRWYVPALSQQLYGMPARSGKPRQPLLQ